MEIYLNGQLYLVPEYFTFHQLFQQSGLPGNINNKFWQRNGSTLLVNQNTLVKDLLQIHDQIILVDKPQKLGSTNLAQQGGFQSNQFGNQFFVPNQGIQQQKFVFQQNQNPQFGIQSGGIQTMNVMKQGSQDSSSPYYTIQTPFQSTNPNPNPIPNLQSFSQPITSQPQTQSNDYDVFQTVQDNNQNNHDVFSTEYQYSNYEKDRQNYLQIKSTCPGNKQDQYTRDNYRFTLDNFGDVLIIEKLDQSFYILITNSFKLNKVRQFDIVNKQKQFESNIILDLNCTRVSWIQDLDLLAVQFNTGTIIAIQIYLE